MKRLPSPDRLNATVSATHQVQNRPRCVSARGKRPRPAAQPGGVSHSGWDQSARPFGRLMGARAVLRFGLHPSGERALAMFEAVGAARDRRLAAEELHPVQQPAERPAAAPRLQVDQRDLAAIMHLHLIDSPPEPVIDQIAEARVESFDQITLGKACDVSARKRDGHLGAPGKCWGSSGMMSTGTLSGNQPALSQPACACQT
jgi:hypothetical protein